jgi:hypothetical protein
MEEEGFISEGRWLIENPNTEPMDGHGGLEASIAYIDTPLLCPPFFSNT